jgi:hypothetical protein
MLEVLTGETEEEEEGEGLSKVEMRGYWDRLEGEREREWRAWRF